MPGRAFLQIPGPTNIPERVLRAMDRPVVDHRGAEAALVNVLQRDELSAPEPVLAGAV
jgi:aspartate aminotransferase-like enzyme